MAINSTHPHYANFQTDWEQMRDTFEGEKAVKIKGTKYLPATSGMVADGITVATAPGAMAYSAYKTRAFFPDTVSDAVEAMLGVMHHKPPVIKLPAAMEPLRNKATRENESLEMFLRRINEEQLVTGRLGILADLPEVLAADVPQLPYLAMYKAETVLNWDAGNVEDTEVQQLNFVALDESTWERQPDFEWEQVTLTRILVLGDAQTNTTTGTYSQAVFRDDAESFDEGKLIQPQIRGTTLEEIPFVFINSKDIVPTPDNPPLLGLSVAALLIYRGEADYRQNLFMQGQDTLVTIGLGADISEDEVRIGAGGRLDLPQGGDAKFVGVGSTGLPEQRTALENDYARANQKGGQLMDGISKTAESGDALRIRVAARTATLNQLALAGAYGLQQILRSVARWIGANPDEVEVIANTDFVADNFDTMLLNQMMMAKVAGAPLSNASIHAWLKEKDMTALDFEAEMLLIESEEPLALGTSDTGGLIDDKDLEEEDDEEDPEE